MTTQSNIQNYLNTNKWRLTVGYEEKLRKGKIIGAELKLMLNSKINNTSPRLMVAKLKMQPDELMNFFQKFSKHHLLKIDFSHHRISLFQELSLRFKDQTQNATQKEIQIVDKIINYGVRYWTDTSEVLQVQLIDEEVIQIKIIERSDQIKIGQVEIALAEFEEIEKIKNSFKDSQSQQIQKKNQLKKKQIELKEKKANIFCEIKNIELKKLTFDQYITILQTKIKKSCSKIYINKQLSEIKPKQKLFQHIFLTEVITHMIINRFGLKKRKLPKYRDGRTRHEYEDQKLQELRSCGYRFYEFRDHSVQPFREVREECKICQEQSSSSEEQNIKEEKSEKQQQNITKKKTELQMVGKKIKNVLKKRGKADHFIMISGEEKSQINKKRYCFHQMTRQADKTQALINFIQLVISSYWPRSDLFQKKEKKRISYFLHKFKVKRQTSSCLREYTRETFFHKVLNIGLRVLKGPHELTYLRLPFSHLFWSIKILYQREKRLLKQNLKQKKEQVSIRLYRGCEMSRLEKRTIKGNVGGFLELQGFLSTTIQESTGYRFATNTMLVFEIPVANLKGMHDHGFAHISSFSDHPTERQVLVNALNTFKIISIQKKQKNDIEIDEIHFEYGSIKQIEDKVAKSQKLLQSEFLMIVEEKTINAGKNLLMKKEEKMTPKMVQKLKEQLVVNEKKLEQWKETLRKQGEQEFKAASKKLSQWQKEVLMNSMHQEDKMKEIDNYGDLLMAVGHYEKGVVYCRKMLKQVQRDRAIEGLWWRNSSCVAHKEAIHRFLISDCKNRLYKYKEAAEELQVVKILYKFLNMDKHYRLKVNLLVRLHCTYLQLGKEFFNRSQRYEKQLREVCEQYKYPNPLEQEIYPIHNVKYLRWQLAQMKVKELEKRKRKQRKRLQRMTLLTDGTHTTKYLQQLYILIQILYKLEIKKRDQEKRSYKELIGEVKSYFSIREKCPEVEYRSTTIRLFRTLTLVTHQFTPKSTKGYELLNFLGSALSKFISLQICNIQQIEVIYYFLRQCFRLQSLASANTLLHHLMLATISCQIEEFQFRWFTQWIFIFGWVLCLGEMKQYREWVEKASGEVYEQYKKWHEKVGWVKEVVNFPESISELQRKECFTCKFDGCEWVNWRKVKEKLDHLQQSCTRQPLCLSDERQNQHRMHELIKYIHIYQSQLYTRSSEKTLHTLLAQGRAEAIVWQQPSYHWNVQYATYGMERFMSTGEASMVVLYLKHPHHHYLRVLSTTHQLHLPQQCFVQLLQSEQCRDRQHMDEKKREVMEKISNKYSHCARKQQNKREQIGGEYRQAILTITLQALVHRQQVPSTLLKALFHDEAQCIQLLKALLSKQKWRKQLVAGLQNQQQLKELIKCNDIRQLINYLHENRSAMEEGKKKRESFRNSVLKILIDEKSFQPHLKQLLASALHYSSQHRLSQLFKPKEKQRILPH